MPELRYMVRRADGAVYGPYPASLLREFAVQGKISPRDFVRPERGTRWEMALRAACLAGTFSASDADAVDLEPPEAAIAPAPIQPAPVIAPVRQPVPHVPVEEPRTSDEGRRVSDEDAQAAIDLAQRLQRARIPIQLMQGESVLVLRQQSFFDAAARSAIAAVMGRRGTLVATTRRIAAVVPGLLGDETTVVDLGRVTSVRVARRIALRRMISGSMLIFNGLLAWAASGLFGFAGSSLSKVLGGMGDLIGGDTSYADGMVSAAQVIKWIGFGLIALGAVALLASIRRALVVHAGSVKVTFHCARAGTRDITAISDAMQGAQ